MNAEMTNDQINRCFAELCGLCWHEWQRIGPGDEFGCKKCGNTKDEKNPNFISDPRLVLREMMKREDYLQFLNTLDKRVGDWQNLLWWVFGNYILDQTGLLAKAGIAWLEKEEGK